MSGAPAEFLAWMQEEQSKLRRPPGIDDWMNEIGAEAIRIAYAMKCTHPHMVGDPESESDPSFTYVLQAVGGGLVKIGRAMRPDDRIRDIQAMSPVKLQLIAIVPGPELERRWHVEFRKARRHGEWFDAEVGDHFRALGAPDTCVRCVLFKDGTKRTETP